MSTNEFVDKWVAEIAERTKPEAVVWCDGSEAEKERLTQEAVRRGELVPLNQKKLPGCYFHRSHPSDVARTEHLTFICTPTKEDSGPTNNWMEPGEARDKVGKLFEGSMRGRTMYVVPFLMGPAGSRFAKVGLEITDSIYVVLNMRIMTRMGKIALQELGASSDFTRCLHSLGDLSPDRRFILHFPQDNEIWSIGSGYGGNALLGKKCLALRIASHLGRKEGWMAEHMLILGVRTPDGDVQYVTAAFPSACGKTNMAMLVPPAPLAARGWKVWTVGDDIAWLRIGDDGRLWAVNPEAGFFGVAPGTSTKTNRNAMETIKRNAIFTNVALKPDGTVWWEGHDDPPVDGMLDWQGKPWHASSGQVAAHPNSRFTAPAAQCPVISPEWENPKGVPVTAILFGARRRRVVPLVYESFDWQHGTFLGATLASETTAAAVGKVGVTRRDPMAMLPFCGYNMADYWGHWLDMGRHTPNLPKIFRVNWFRTDAEGKYLWPGFGENLRVLEWVLDRCRGGAKAQETPIGYVPTERAIDSEGLNLPEGAMRELLRVERDDWAGALRGQREYFETFGDHLPRGIREEHEALGHRLAVTL
jgi:phosphoenolpyruvate carboxykinase (GTP)